MCVFDSSFKYKTISSSQTNHMCWVKILFLLFVFCRTQSQRFQKNHDWQLKPKRRVSNNCVLIFNRKARNLQFSV